MPKVLNLEYVNPKTKAKSTGKMEIKNLTPKTAELSFYGDICSSTWDVWQQEDMCPQDVSDFLNNLDGAQNITVYINSGGGDSFAGLAIFNILKRHAARKEVHVDALAASAASAIAMVGTLEGNTLIIHVGAQVMIHNAWTIAMGNADDFRKLADTLDKVSASYVDVYAENAVEGVTREKFKEMMDAEKWMNGSEAATYWKNVQTEGGQIAACADSQYFSRYINLPKDLKIKQETTPPPVPPTPDDSEEKTKLAKAKLALSLAL